MWGGSSTLKKNTHRLWSLFKTIHENISGPPRNPFPVSFLLLGKGKLKHTLKSCIYPLVFLFLRVFSGDHRYCINPNPNPNLAKCGGQLVSEIQPPRNEQINETNIVCLLVFPHNLKPEVTPSQFPQLPVAAGIRRRYHGHVGGLQPCCFLQCREGKESREKEDNQWTVSKLCWCVMAEEDMLVAHRNVEDGERRQQEKNCSRLMWQWWRYTHQWPDKEPLFCCWRGEAGQLRAARESSH